MVNILQVKIFDTKQIRDWDAYTIKHEPITSIDLMERAATMCFEWIRTNVRKECPVKIFCGRGNNGGDGLVIARLLHEEAFDVSIYVFTPNDKGSNDFIVNEKRAPLVPNYIKEEKDIPELFAEDIIIDALLGSGLTKTINGLLGKIVEQINHSKSTVIAIDVPSGLPCDIDNTALLNGTHIVKADYTLTFEAPKHSFMFADSHKYTGEWLVLPIGLNEEYKRNTETKNFYLRYDEVMRMMKSRGKFSHKGTFGHALLIGGSYGKMGAMQLSSKACMRSGVGLLTTYVPGIGYAIMQITVPESMEMTDGSEQFITHLKINTDKFSAIGIGPGMGTAEATSEALIRFLDTCDKPLVIDADALNMIAEHMAENLDYKLPENCIITPHPGEMKRLVGETKDSYELHKMQVAFARHHEIYVVLKGAHTAIACPDGRVYYNSTGNAGMATAGSGDVLTGIITGLLAQGYTQEEAALLGVFMHGSAGDKASLRNSKTALIATDIIDNIGAFYRDCELKESNH